MDHPAIMQIMPLSNKSKPITTKAGLNRGDLIDKVAGSFLQMADTDEINMNSLYLKLIFDEMVSFVNASHRQDLSAMFDALTVIDALISPKVLTDDYQLKLRWIEVNLPKAVLKDEDGNPVYYLPSLCYFIRKQLYVIFKIMLKLIDEKGMLTFTKQPPSKAMSKYRSA
jgi:hypothetical protein